MLNSIVHRTIRAALAPALASKGGTNQLRTIGQVSEAMTLRASQRRPVLLWGMTG